MSPSMTTCALLISVILMSHCVCVVALVCAGVCVKGLLPVKVYVRAREVLSRTSPLLTEVNKYLDLKALTNYD